MAKTAVAIAPTAAVTGPSTASPIEPPCGHHVTVPDSLADGTMTLEICELGPAQFFGERAQILKEGGMRSDSKGVHTASVVSVTDVDLLVLNK